jgi:hypothetical protein
MGTVTRDVGRVVYSISHSDYQCPLRNYNWMTQSWSFIGWHIHHQYHSINQRLKEAAMLLQLHQLVGFMSGVASINLLICFFSFFNPEYIIPYRLF